jgi:lycopene cyclase domain-containing protein
MFGRYTYLIWLALFIGIPLLLLLIQHRALWQRRVALAWVVVGSLVGGWAWDALAVQLGLWYYDPNNLFGWWWFGLPLEEWLWIVGTTLMFSGLTVILADRWGAEEVAAPPVTTSRQTGDQTILEAPQPSSQESRP